MPSIQVKDVPPETHAVFQRRAAAAHQSLQEYLWTLLVDEASRPTMDEVFADLDAQQGGHVSFAEAAALIRADRDST